MQAPRRWLCPIAQWTSNMRNRLCLLVALFLLAAPVAAQQPVRPVDSGGTNTTDSTAHAGKVLSVDSTGTPIPDESAHDAAYGTLAPVGVGGFAASVPCTAVTAGDKARLCLTLNGAPYVQPSDGTNLKVFDPCETGTKTTTAFSQTAIANIITADAAKKNYICAFTVVAGSAEVVSIVEDDTTACASPTAALMGSTTAANGLSFAANGGMTLGNGESSVLVGSATNRYLCVAQSGSNRVSGFVTWVQR